VSLDAATVHERLGEARAAIAGAAQRAGRDPDAVELLAATKYVEAADLDALAEAGIALLGENRTDALLAKQARPGSERFTWDFIGRVQSRKVRDLVGRVRLVHAIDSLSACEQIERRASAPVACLIEVNVAGEASKGGIAAGDVDGFLEQVAPLGRVRVEGLMTMPPFAERAEASRPAFAALRALAADLAGRWSGRFSFERLSMGTSQDFAVAVEEGASIVRLGSVLYGRPAE
jgi:pyridoxal phosphate enzyme (YggS family)